MRPSFQWLIRVAPRVLIFAALTVLVACSDPSGERELRSGIREYKRGNYERAFTLFQRSIDKRPGHLDNAATHNYLGLAATRLNRFGEAKTAFEDSRRLNPNFAEPVYNLGVLSASKLNNFSEAVRHLNEAAALKPQDPRPLEYLADLYMNRPQPQWTLARNVLYSALDREPRSARIYNALGVANIGLQQPDQALEALMFALEIDSKYAPALLNLGIVYDSLIGDADQARAYYKRFIDVAPRDERIAAVRDALNRINDRGVAGSLHTPVPPPAEIPPAQVVATSPAPLAVTSAPPAAVAATTPPPAAATPAPTTPAPAETPVVVARAPEPTPAPTPAPPPPPVKLSPYETFMKQAEERARSGQMQRAIDSYVRAAEAADSERRVDLQERAYREAARVAVDQPRAHVLLGQHMLDRGRDEEAGRAFRTAATINADFAPAQLGLARLAVRNNEADAAVVHYRRAMTSDPAMSDAAWEFAQLYDKQLDLPENAARAYREFAEKFPNDRRRATALQRAEELAPAPRAPAVTSMPSSSGAATAAPASTPAAASAPATSRRIEYRAPARRNTPAAMQAFNRGVSYQERQDWERAIFFYQRALENDDQQSRTFYNLGICYTKTGERELARDAYNRAIRLQPDLHDAQYNLALLYRESGDLQPAIRLLQEIVSVDNNYAAAHYLLGTIYGSSSRTRDQARQHYERFLQLAPNDRSAPAIRQWLSNN